MLESQASSKKTQGRRQNVLFIFCGEEIHPLSRFNDRNRIMMLLSSPIYIFG